MLQKFAGLCGCFNLFKQTGSLILINIFNDKEQPPGVKKDGKKNSNG